MRLFFFSFLALCQLKVLAAQPVVGSRVFIKADMAPVSGESGVDIRATVFSQAVSRREGEFLWVGSTRLHSTKVLSPTEALSLYEDQVRRTPGNAAAHRCLGAAKCDSGNLAAAIHCMDEAIRLGSDDALSHYLRGIVFLKMHAKREIGWGVIDYWHFGPAGLAFYLNHEDSLTNRHRINRYDSVASQFSFRVENSFGIRADEGELERAINDFTAALRRDPDSVLVACGRGIAWNNIGEFDKARNDFTSAIVRDPKAPYPLQCLAFIQACCVDSRIAITIKQS